MKFVASMVVALLSGAALAQSAPSTGDASAGQRKTQMCIGCHGIDGWRTAYPEVYRVPLIHGQHQAYLVKALQGYRSGERSHRSMRAIAAGLSDKDIADLAAYYGAPSAPAAPASSTTAATPTSPATTPATK